MADYSFELDTRNVHVWSVGTEDPEAIAASFEQVLAPDERDRAARFRFEHLRRSFILAHGALRMLLGRYLDTSAAGIRFEYGSKGKPALAPRAFIDFNMSHSGGLVVFAFTRGCEIGVDLEQIHSIGDMQNIADRFFCPEEAAELMSLPVNQREHAFFLCWTRKEAYIKAIGDGLSAPLNDFRVTMQSAQHARFIHIAHDTNAAKEWTLHDLQLASNYAAALAYRGSGRTVAVLPLLEPAELLHATRQGAG
jgi:4'-phosphopantetheinyl transferase